ncbi:hypothetical protein PS652_01618 [Pseudomonas fluorescens]|uniref:Uncharacterized protein n=1 Tax=Pseudomonas fluorescens TaxID=294 RepID=A0A5E6WJ44_PSEFL|nr:hypothetical protein PS652_04748 [Pseudomonas fluorescens]
MTTFQFIAGMAFCFAALALKAYLILQPPVKSGPDA